MAQVNCRVPKASGKKIITPVDKPRLDVKWCPACQKLKPLKEFYKNSYRSDGYASECAKCQQQYHADWKRGRKP